MYIMLGVFVAAYLVTAYFLKWGADDDLAGLPFRRLLTAALVPATVAAVILGGVGWIGAYQIQQDPVEVNYPIYPGPDGRYTYDNGSTTTWYYKDGIALKEAWKDSSYVTVNYMPEGSRAHVEAMCESSETVPRWLLPPWERDENHVWHRECSYEEFDVFIPLGES